MDKIYIFLGYTECFLEILVLILWCWIVYCATNIGIIETFKRIKGLNKPTNYPSTKNNI